MDEGETMSVDPWEAAILGSGLSGIAQPEPWVDGAVCKSVDADLFFPEEGHGLEAKRICNGTKDIPACPVKKDCLAYAVRHKERTGIWGGKSTSERMHLERINRGAKQCRMCGVMFNPLTANVLLCSDDCRRKARREKARRAG